MKQEKNLISLRIFIPNVLSPPKRTYLIIMLEEEL